MEIVTPDQIPTGLTAEDRGYAVKVELRVADTITWNGEQWLPTVDLKYQLPPHPHVGMRYYIGDVEHEFDGDEWLIV